MGWKKTLTFMPYGSEWKMHRKLLQRELTLEKVAKWQPFQAQEARRAVRHIASGFEGWDAALRRFAVAVALKVSHGVDVDDDRHPYMEIAYNAMEATGNGGAPANSLVDIFPPRKLPCWESDL